MCLFKYLNKGLALFEIYLHYQASLVNSAVGISSFALGGIVMLP